MAERHLGTRAVTGNHVDGQPIREARFDLTTFGETMVRLSTPHGIRLPDATGLSVHAGGAESNVAADLAQLGRSTLWCSALPDHAMGDVIIRRIAATGVDTSCVQRIPGSRVGVYYLDSGVDPAAPEVIYDRGDTAFASLRPQGIPLKTLLDTRVLHLTGISAAVGKGPREVLELLATEARGAGVTLSFDVNFRARLWPASEARETLAFFLERADVLFLSARDAATVFEVSGPPEAVLRGIGNQSSAHAIILSRGAAGVSALLDGHLHEVQALPVTLLDRPGAGDALAAGVLDGLMDDDILGGLSRGVSLSASALTQFGDMVTTSRRNLERMLSDGGSTIAR